MLSELTAVVSGGSNGIGRAICLAFAEQGATVINADLERSCRTDERPTDSVVGETTTGEFVETDVSESTSVEALFERVAAEYGGADVLVNNAAYFGDDSVGELSVDTWEQAVEVNLTGAFLMSKFGLDQLLENDGSILNVSSAAGIRASTKRAAYCASKAGLTNLTRQLVLDYGAEGLRANSIHPGLVDTASSEGIQDTSHGRRILDGHPMDRLACPEEVANAAVFLASDLAGYVNGHALVVDGGLSAKYY